MKFKKILSKTLLCALICSNFVENKINAQENLNVISTPFSILANIDITNTLKNTNYSIVSENESVLPEDIRTVKVFTTEDLKLRKSTDEESEVLTVIPKGSEVIVTFSGDKWSDITFDGNSGIASSEYLYEKEVSKIETKENEEIEKETEISNEKENNSEIKNTNEFVETKKEVVNETPKQKEIEYKTISLYTTDVLNAREKKSTSSNIITVLSKGTYLTGKDHGDWLEININGKTAFVMKKYLSDKKPVVEVVKKEETVKETPKENLPTPNYSSVEKMVQSALNQVGKPYVFASANPSVGFDCSGLTYYAFSQVGVYLSRTAQSQFGYGTFIPKSEIQRGDLLFFSNGNGIGHVGIYLGNGKMVHASTYDTGVIVSNIGIGYYVNNYAGARRILK